MNSPSLPANWADLPDDKLGEELLTLWTHYQVAKRGICPEGESTDIAEGLLNATLLMDTDVAKDAPIEKALQRAASGDFTGAGSLTRDLIQDGAIVMLLEKWAQTGLQFRLNQSKKAKKSRGKINTDDGETTTVSEIITKLATKQEFIDWYASELWDRFLSELVGLCLDPEENTGSSDKSKRSISYDFNDERKSITFGQFSNVVSEARSNKKSG